MKIMLTINGQDFAPILSSFAIEQEVKYEAVITTLDGKEHPKGRTSRDIITFSVLYNMDGLRDDYRALTQEPLIVEYEHPNTGYHKREFRLDCDISDKFMLTNIHDKNIYQSGEITLRALEVDR